MNKQQLQSAFEEAKALGDFENAYSIEQELNATPDDVNQSAPPERGIGTELVRQGGLTARHAIEGVTSIGTGINDAVNMAVNEVLRRMGVDYRQGMTSQMVSETLTDIGLPQPEGKWERGVGDVSRALAAGGSLVQVGKKLGGAASVLAEAPLVQATAETAGASASAYAREKGLSPGMQTAAGLAAGVTAPFLPSATSATVRGVSGVRDMFTNPGQRRIVAETIQDRASNATTAKANLDAAPSTLTDQTTGPLSGDHGLLTLERSMRNTDTTGRFAAHTSSANQRRQEILDVLGGEDLAVSRATRDATTGPAREAALTTSDGVALDVQPVINVIEGLLKTPQAARKVIKQALNTTRKDIEGVSDARTLYEIRKDINEAMQGKFRNPDRADFKMAKGQLKIIKNAIDDQIESVAPGFKKYLSDYAAISKDIDQREIVQSIQERARVAVPDATTGRDVLSQAKFRRMVDKERNAGSLTQDQLKVLGAISDDLDLGQAINASGIRPQGSDTAQNLTVAHVIGRTLGGNTDNAVINTLARPIKWLSGFSEEQVQQMLVDAMLDPKLARQLLAEARPNTVQSMSLSLRQVARATGVGLAAEEISASRAPTQ